MRFETSVVIPAGSIDAVDAAFKKKSQNLQIDFLSEGDPSYFIGFFVYPDTVDGKMVFTRTNTVFHIAADCTYVLEADLSQFPWPARVRVASSSDDDCVSHRFGPDGNGLMLDLVFLGPDAPAPAKAHPKRAKATASTRPEKPKFPKAKPDKGRRSELSDAETTAIDVIFDGGAGAEREIRRADDEGQEADYILEAHLEALVAALEKKPAAVDAHLATLDKHLAALGAALESPWLSEDLAGWEVRVRAAEALGALSAAIKEDPTVIAIRLEASDPAQRMWAARAVRAMKLANAGTLLAPLAQDPFRDGDGAYLVREAAGFVD